LTRRVGLGVDCALTKAAAEGEDVGHSGLLDGRAVTDDMCSP
jgi:hypothetical protein